MKINLIQFMLIAIMGLVSCKKEKPSDLVAETTIETAENKPLTYDKNTKEPVGSVDKINTEVDPATAPVAKFTKLEHDFGTISYGKKVTHEFSFTNTGKTPLVIKSVTPSCGCTVPETPKEPFAPGETGKISVVYNPKNSNGIQGSSVTVKTNAVKETQILRIKANVVNAPGNQSKTPNYTAGGPVKS